MPDTFDDHEEGSGQDRREAARIAAEHAWRLLREAKKAFAEANGKAGEDRMAFYFRQAFFALQPHGDFGFMAFDEVIEAHQKRRARWN